MGHARTWVDVKHLTFQELEAGLEEIRQSPKDYGTVKMIVRRPETNERESLTSAELDTAQGLVGDNWLQRGSSATADRSAHPEMQLNIMNARAIKLIANSVDRWPLAGDQIFVDLDLSKDNLPAGTQLELGSAIIEVSRIPHTGCRKFVDRFGEDAMNFVNSEVGKKLCLRGINARITKSGTFTVGDMAHKMP
jgi:MOSC domain-containing protein YiiM